MTVPRHLEHWQPRPAGDAVLVPLVVGVTGHRELAEHDRQPLCDAVRSILRRLRNERPTGPLVVVTPLAEGADQLVATVAIAEFDAQLVVPLPLPRAEYERDFVDPASRRQFDELLDGPWTVRCLEMPAVNPSSDQTPDAHTLRALQYALAGAFVARNCGALIALWDGVESTRMGGTAQIVRLRRSGQLDVPEPFADWLAAVPDPFGVRPSPLDEPETGIVHHLVTPRVGRARPEGAFECRLLAPVQDAASGGSAQVYLRRTREIDAYTTTFNADLRAARERETDALAAREPPPPVARAGAALPSGLGTLWSTFTLVDLLAGRLQQRTYRVLRHLFVVSTIAVLAYEAYSDLYEGPHAVGFLLAYLFVLACADLLFLHARRHRVQDRFQDYRAVAEGLRVLFFWRLAGLPQAASDYYLRKQRDELRWIRDAVRAWSVVTTVSREAHVDVLLDHWVRGQRRYFEETARREQHRLLRSQGIGNGLLIALLVLSIAWTAVSVRCETIVAGSGGSSWLAPLVVVALVTLAVTLGYNLLRVLRQNSRASAVDSRPGLWWWAIGFVIGAAFTGVMALPAWSAGTGLCAAHAPEASHSIITRDPRALLVTTIGLLGLGGALLHAYAERHAFAEHARQYERMAHVFASAEVALEALVAQHRTDGVEQLVLELGREALAEHGDWVLLHRDRPIELPKPDV